MGEQRHKCKSPGVHHEPEVQQSGAPSQNCLNLEFQEFKINGASYAVPSRYTVLDSIGEGAYGVVVSAQDETTQEKVAIKKIENAFENMTFARRALRELRILRQLDHENVIDVRSIFFAGSKNSFEDIYVVTTLMETDLANIIKSNQALSDDHNLFFVYQIMRGMKYVHSAGVIHRDLKPRNLLVNGNCDLRICDFGLARMEFPQHLDFRDPPMTTYICTRWYRAPEVLCNWTGYSKAIDVWSIGCIFAEMLGRKPLFKGCSTKHQLKVIIDFLGLPSSEALEIIQDEKCRKWLESLPPTQGQAFETVCTKANPPTLDFLSKMLKFDPARRITIDDALTHEYLAQLHCPDDEPMRDLCNPEDFEFERRKIDVRVLREELYIDILKYHPDLLSRYNEEQKENPNRFDITQFRLLEPGETLDSSDEEEEEDRSITTCEDEGYQKVDSCEVSQLVSEIGSRVFEALAC